ncbi:hypothetical protein BJ322DRAFT_1131556 [Thelephora terrestris]|uniref:Protein kinase domain-containing protein n=1 Tax=Thelephora terrestris TaxID=56493 RepID=A0A9P6H374_9AGAM|nr:hypothetical protein BJ322DRAFT_1131556 [Thelephora terrestris]
MIIMADEVYFSFPVLLAAPPGSDKPYQPIIHAEYDHLTSERAYPSALQETALEAVRVSPEVPNTALDSAKVIIYELYEPLPPTRGSLVDMTNAYRFINGDYLKAKATFLSPRWRLDRVKPGNLIAVLMIKHPVPSIIHELNESDAKIRREEIAVAARKRDSPSAGASLTRRIVTQTDFRADTVYNYRPANLAPPPITIYHPVFAKFLQLMAEPRNPTHEELNLAHDFVCLASAYHKDEATRIGELSFNMRAAVHFGIPGPIQLAYQSRQLVLDGVVTSAATPDGFRTIAAILEVKAEIGEGGSDPIAQAECAYVAVYSTEEALHTRAACCCPAFIIGMPGPYIIVGGAVFADTIITQTLTDYISVIPRPNQNNRSPLDDAAHRVANLFRALKECIGDLDTYYSRLVQTMSFPRDPQSGTGASICPPVSAGAVHTLESPSFVGPHFTRYHDSEGKEVVLTYRARLQPHFLSKAVFVAEAKSESRTEQVVVKFAYTYNREAHELLASAEHAPKLRYCKFEPSVGMWIIVMDYVEGSAVEDGGVLEQTVHIESLRAALEKLHGRGLVFGDLRPPNVLIVGEKVVLIDFDWCGKAGQARYPSDIILQEGVWHREVQRGGLMTQAHDEYHFQKLTWPMNKDHSLK